MQKPTLENSTHRCKKPIEKTSIRGFHDFPMFPFSMGISREKPRQKPQKKPIHVPVQPDMSPGALPRNSPATGKSTMPRVIPFKNRLPSGKHTKNYGKSPFLMGKSTISMAIFNSYVTNYQRVLGASY